MTGKEALKHIKENTRYRYVGWHNWHTEAIEKDLDELAKYKRAFEILKKYETFLVEADKLSEARVIRTKTNVMFLNKEEYELLEELMSDD